MNRMGIFFSIVCLLMSSVLAQSLFAQAPLPSQIPTYPLPAWKEYTVAEAQFAAAFPIKPNEVESPEGTPPPPPGPGSKPKVKAYEVSTMEYRYAVIYTKLPQGQEETAGQLKQRLREKLKQMEEVQGQQYKWLGGKEIELDGYPGIEFKHHYLNTKTITWQRELFVNDRIYTVLAVSSADKPEMPEPKLFMDSFRLLSPTATAQTKAETASPPIATPRPTTQRVSSGVLQELAIKKVTPEIPSQLRGHVKGTVMVAITISETGNVEKASVVSGHPLLQEACLEAAKQWQFKPTLLGNNPIKVQGILPFNFQ